MSALPKPDKKLTIDEFVEWCAEQDGDDRWELIEGVPSKMMAPQTRRHVRVKAAVWLALSQAIRGAGLPCEALIDGVGVKTGESSSRIPDVSVECGRTDDNDIWLSDPVVLVEVVSRRSGARDGDEKLIEYFSLPSVRHYLLVYPERRIVVHHRRDADLGEIATRIVEMGTIDLSPPGFAVDVASFFADP